MRTMSRYLEVIVKSESAMTGFCKHIADHGGSGYTRREFDIGRPALAPS
jgi:hypothetical protein